MQHIRLADPEGNGNHSPLGDSLIQIAEREAKALAQAASTEPQDDVPSEEWQKRFSKNRAKISRRLQMIEAELDNMNESGPSLTVFDGGKSD
jgi:hypothetical protein